MSYILDALKKSDSQRRDREAPGVQSIHAPYLRNRQSHKSVLRPLLLLLLVVAGAASWWAVPWKNLGFHESKGQDSLVADPQTGVTGKPVHGSVETKQNTVQNVEQDAPTALIEELWEINSSRQRPLDDLNFSLHVWAENPSNRTIIINGRRMRAGQAINNQISLEEITPDGVIVSDRQGKIKLVVVDNW
jgi:general secretion pathway protein B